MEAMIIVAGSVITLFAIAALWNLGHRPQKPESLESIIKRAVETSIPCLEWAVREFAKRYPTDIRNGCQIHINVRPREESDGKPAADARL